MEHRLRVLVNREGQADLDRPISKAIYGEEGIEEQRRGGPGELQIGDKVHANMKINSHWIECSRSNGLYEFRCLTLPRS